MRKFKRVEQFKKSRFFLAILCLIIGATSTIIYYEGKDLYDWIRVGLSYTTRIEIVKAEASENTPIVEVVQTASPVVDNEVVGATSPDDITSVITRYFGGESQNAIKVSFCESSHNPSAVNINKDGSVDRGLWQINNKWHPEVSEECAFDIECSTKEAKRIYDKGSWNPWMCKGVIK